MAILTSGTYTLNWGTISNAPLNQTIASPKKATVTYGAGYLIINGTRYNYTASFGGSPSVQGWGNLNMAIFQLSGGGYLVLGDPALNLSAYTYMLPNSSGTGTSIAVKQNKVTTPIATWGFNKGAGGMWNGKCFLTGTLIATPDGHIAVEKIIPGTQVMTHDKDGNSIIREVRWVGRNHITRQDGSDHLDNSPIRIKKNAFAENVPFKDCLLTSEHCLLIKGQFVPVRMLVNDRSIYRDTTIYDYDYFHIELDEHSILESDGILTESYLRTEENEFLHSIGNTSSPVKNWQQNAAAPLNTSTDFVEPIYQLYASRAETLGFPLTEQKIIESSVIEIMDQHGNLIKASRKNGNHHLFYIDRPTQNIQIRSGSGKPSDITGPFVDDRRDLGILVGKIEIISAKGRVEYTDHLEVATLDGWHVQEKVPYRWTNGLAQLHNLGEHENYFLSIEVVKHFPSVAIVDLLQEDGQLLSVAS